MPKSALKRAVQEHLIPFNPAEFCIPPKIIKPDLQVIPSERYQSYLHAAEQRGKPEEKLCIAGQNYVNQQR